MNKIVLWELPDNWQWAIIADLGDVVSGGTPSTKNPFFWGGEVNWITPADLSGYNGKFITSGAKSLTVDGLEGSSAKLMPPGSIHFSSRAPIGYVVISKTEISTNQGFKSLVPARGIFNEYIYYYLRSAKQIAEERASGTTFKELSGKAFSELPVPLAPLNEQYRIVTKIEELFSDLDNGIEYLKTAREQLKVHRQAVLKHAFEGKLTEHWREAHADQLEIADQLLERIKQERENFYQQQLNEWEELIKAWEGNGKEGKKPSKPKEPESFPPLTENELKEMPALPVGWIWLRLGNLNIDVFDGPFGSNLKTSDYVDEGVRVIRLENIGVLKFNNEHKAYITREKYEVLKKHTVIPGDVIFASFVVDETRVTVVPSFIGRAINKADCFCVRCHGNIIQNNFIAKFLSTRNAYHQLKSQVHGATRPRINTTQLKYCAIPVASLAEQERIIAEIEEKFSIAKQLESEIEHNLKRVELLRHSILKRAFLGLLVLQDPNDDPASTLLEQIRLERQSAPKPTRKPSISRKEPRKKEVMDLVSVLGSANNWLRAQDVFRECGIGDGAETEAIEKLYFELRDLERENRIEVERRGDEDWLRIRPTGRS